MAVKIPFRCRGSALEDRTKVIQRTIANISSVAMTHTELEEAME